ncbi:hypothetical protein QQ045_029840 [Rhodiola kirilowii]
MGLKPTSDSRQSNRCDEYSYRVLPTHDVKPTCFSFSSWRSTDFQFRRSRHDDSSHQGRSSVSSRVATSPASPYISPLHQVGTEEASNGTSTISKPSFASIVELPKVTPRFPEIQLASRQYGVMDGVPSITFSPVEYQAATQRFAHTLIAIGRPLFEVVKKTMLAASNIEGRVTIASNWDDRHVIIILDSEKDVNDILTNPFRRVGHTMF